MSRSNGFRLGSGCFNCSDCSRKTRHTGEQAMGSDLCPQCWEVAGIYNELQDGMITEAEYDQAILPYHNEVVTLGGTPTY